MRPPRIMNPENCTEQELIEHIGKLEQEIERLENVDRMLAPTIGENGKLKMQVDTLIHAMSRLVLDRYVDREGGE